MRKIVVAPGSGRYEIHIGSGLLEKVGLYLKELGLIDKTVIITNPLVNGLYGGALKSSLVKDGYKVAVIEVPDGEEYKSLDMAGRLYNGLSEFHAERLTPVIALGGGVIGDLAGFVAATYMRGVPLVQVPTTLLAQVDSSIGGKVAVNHGQLKNKVGAFYQPRLVVSDVSTLKTLTDREISDGLAEIIKYGVIRDKALFELVEANIGRVKSLDVDLLEEIVFRCASIKADVVEKDEKDFGLRNILNYGHTVGHAVETVSDFKIEHGRAVAIGMVAAGLIAARLDLFSQDELRRLRNLIAKAGLPVAVSATADVKKLIQAMEHDKKVSRGKIKLVLLKSIGEVFITDEVSTSVVEEVLRSLRA